MSPFRGIARLDTQRLAFPLSLSQSSLNVPRPTRGGLLRSAAEWHSLGRLRSGREFASVIELARRLPDLPVMVAGEGRLAEEVIATANELPNLSYLGWLVAPMFRHSWAASVSA